MAELQVLQVIEAQEPQTTTLSLAEKLDEYCELSEKIEEVMKPIAPLVKKQKKLEETLLATIDAHLDPAVTAALAGLQYEGEVGAKGRKTVVVDRDKLIEALGLDLFLKIAEVSVTDMRRYLTDDQLATIIEQPHVNKRSIKFWKKAVEG
jgi:hypothetical protein